MDKFSALPIIYPKIKILLYNSCPNIGYVLLSTVTDDYNLDYQSTCLIKWPVNIHAAEKTAVKLYLIHLPHFHAYTFMSVLLRCWEIKPMSSAHPGSSGCLILTSRHNIQLYLSKHPQLPVSMLEASLDCG